LRIILSACLVLVCLGVVRPGHTRAAASAGFNAGQASDDVAYLSEVVGPRPKGSEGQRLASDYVARQFEQAGLTVERQVFTAESSGMLYSGSNIVGDLPRSGDVILICAHLDTVPVSPGANDNASGVAAMLELARVTRARTYPFGLRYIAFDGEEPNRDGSAFYIGELSADQRAAISLVLNLDMVGAGGPWH